MLSRRARTAAPSASVRPRSTSITCIAPNRSAGRRAVDARQSLLRGHGAVPFLGGVRQLSQLPQAPARLAEVVEQAHCAGSRRFRTSPSSASSLRARDALVLLAGFGLVDHPAQLHDVGQAVGHPRIGGQRRRGRRGRFPGNSPRCSSAGRGARRSARRACRCPCRRRWSPPSRCRPRAGSGAGVRRASRASSRRGRAARRCRAFARNVGGLVHLLRATGSRRCRRRPACSLADEVEQLLARVVLLDDAVADVRAVEARRRSARASSSSRRSTISSRVAASAVAVSAMRGTSGSARAAATAGRYSGRKSWPHCETQCASSMANSAMRARSSSSRQRGVSRRSGAT